MRQQIILFAILILVACGGESGVDEPQPEVTPSEVSSVSMPAADPWSVEALDTDRDGDLSVAELDQVWPERFDQWDIDADGSLDAEESGILFWGLFDRDGDFILTQEEFERATERWSFIDWAEWGRWDGDADGTVAETEWLETWRSVGWPSWVESESISSRELKDRFWSVLEGGDEGPDQ